MADESKSYLDQYKLGDTNIDPALDFDEPPPATPTPARDETTPEVPVGRASAGAASSTSAAAESPVVPERQTLLHSPSMRRQAEAVGLLEDEIEEMTPIELQRAVAVQTRLLAQENRALRQSSPAGAVGEVGKPTATAGVGETPVAPAASKEFDLQFEQAGEYDPALMNMMRGHFGRQQERIDKLEAVIASLMQRETAREQLTMRQRLDQMFDATSAERGNLFGTGAELDDGQRYRRDVLIQTMEGVRQGREKAKRKGTIESDYQEAIGLLYGVQPRVGVKADAKPAGDGKQPAPQAFEPDEEFPDDFINGRVQPRDPSTGQFQPRVITREQWNRGGLARPSSRKGAAEPKGPEKAEQTARDHMKANGLLEGDEGILNGLLD